MILQASNKKKKKKTCSHLETFFLWKMTYFLMFGFKPKDELDQTTTQIIN